MHGDRDDKGGFPAKGDAFERDKNETKSLPLVIISMAPCYTHIQMVNNCIKVCDWDAEPTHL